MLEPTVPSERVLSGSHLWVSNTLTRVAAVFTDFNAHRHVVTNQLHLLGLWILASCIRAIYQYHTHCPRTLAKTYTTLRFVNGVVCKADIRLRLSQYPVAHRLHWHAPTQLLLHH